MINRTLRIISLAVITATLLASALAQGQQQKDEAKGQRAAAAPGRNTPGRIAKFTTTKNVGDSNITEDAAGNIGIGTTLPTSMLTVNGVIEMIGQGGIKFPDGTIQTTAGLATVTRDNTLKGDGTQASPLGLSAPLILSESIARGIIQATNNGTSGIGIEGRGGELGAGVVGHGGIGGTCGTCASGPGVRGNGGDSTLVGGTGVFAWGGRGDVLPGFGIEAFGGNATSNTTGGMGMRVTGGTGNGVGKRGGVGIFAEFGFGTSGATKGLAGFFSGDVQVQGTLSKFAGSFKIDHPLDPENKYLSHSFVESPDMMNIYNGNTSTDQNGIAVVELPDYFETLNSDFRYQLTVVGRFAQAIVAEKVKTIAL